MKVSYYIAGDNNRLVRVSEEAAMELERCNAALMECPTKEWERYEPVYKLYAPVNEKAAQRRQLVMGLMVLIGAFSCLLGELLGAMVAIWL